MFRKRFKPPAWLRRIAPAMFAFALVCCMVAATAAPTFAAEPVVPSMAAGDAAAMGDEILGVFTQISEWIASAVPSLMPMFYTQATGLTFLGWTALAGLAFSVVFLCLALVMKFLRFG